MEENKRKEKAKAERTRAIRSTFAQWGMHQIRPLLKTRFIFIG